MTVVEAPPNVGYGKVVGRFLSTLADTDDPDQVPNSVPMSGKVTFICDVPYLLDRVSTPPTTLIPARIDCKLDDDGYLVDADGDRGVWLIATNGPTEPTGFTYQVTLAFHGQAARTFPIQVPNGGVIDLTLVAPMATSLGQMLTKGEKGDKGDQGDVGPLPTDAQLMAVMDGLYIPRTESTLGIDTDGVPFINVEGVPLVSAGRIFQDTDGVPYFEMV